MNHGNGKKIPFILFFNFVNSRIKNLIFIKGF